MLLAELGRVEAHLVDGVVIPKEQIFAASS
jgi:hypothetical protein